MEENEDEMAGSEWLAVETEVTKKKATEILEAALQINVKKEVEGE